MRIGRGRDIEEMRGRADLLDFLCPLCIGNVAVIQLRFV
jgi:hypothetical protein